ncbi:family 95 glycoside hydrolase [Meira miltonrushii]|uniref:Family 95 glycoside hydrolase n=1 Tax=Meira miltonrushii TaxID=1280837 RepID=A0A316V2Y9_9BASI|nr:family 95 glycoside hydrolase [Meira miltonrushii]PWN31929.1 family 95 glycoside hydrolase [Meira miltonrushii]
MLFNILSLVLLSITTARCQTFDGKTFLHYTSPATQFTETLPIGNGRLGLGMYGTPAEQLILNEDSTWNSNFVNRVNPNAKGSWQRVRSEIVDNKWFEAGNDGLRNMVPEDDEPGRYQNAGFLNVDMGQEQSGMSNYVRWLDTINGITGTNYTYSGAQISRIAIASYPDGVMAMRIASDQPFSANVSFSRAANIYNSTATTDGGKNVLLTYSGSNSQPGGLDFAMQGRVVVDQGSVSAKSSNLTVTNVKTLDIFMDIETTYRQSDYKGQTDTVLDAAVSKGWNTIFSNAVQDHSKIASAVTMDLGTTSNTSLAQSPTDQRLTAFKSAENDDNELMTLVYNFGRHLMISSSRQGTKSLPANLVGLWLDELTAAWGGRFTVNINLEMNYWAVGAGNMAADTQISLFDLMDVARPRGDQMAKDMYGIESGIVFHHNLDLWGDAAPVDNGTRYTLWPMSAPWLSTHIMEHVRFTNDLDFLKNRGLPFLLDTSAFYDSFLFEYDGNMVTGPSLSPENGFNIPANGDKPGYQNEGMDIAPAMDNQLLWQMYADIDEAYQRLGDPNNTNATHARDMQSKLRPNFLGSYGQILEWREEYVDTTPGITHISPLWGLHPGKQFSPLINDTLAEGARKLLDNRMANGGGANGWSRTWVASCYARLFDGVAAWANSQETLKTFLLSNLWNSDSGPGSPFQIDGNFGYLSTIQEMLLQSHTGIIHLLPALPANVSTSGGSFKGLLARQGFSVDMSWDQNASLKQATITSNLGNELSLRLTNGTNIKVNGNDYTAPLQTTKGQTYTVTLA